MSGGTGGLLADSHTWILFSAIIFSVVAWKKGKKPLLEMIDGRTSRIKAELEEAIRLKTEAEKLLKEYKTKHAEASKEATKIMADANNYAMAIKKDAENKLLEQIKRREELLIEQIKRAEESAVEEVRNKATDLAMNAAKKLINDNISGSNADLVGDAIKELPKKLG